MQSDEQQVTVSPSLPLRQVLAALQDNTHRLCVVIDDEGKPLGTITDGDCRRALLRTASLDTPAEDVMNRNFIVVEESMSADEMASVMQSHGISQVPIVGPDRRVRDVVSLRSFNFEGQPRDNIVVVLAGGKGLRLRPLTNNIPKPMLKIGRKPMLQLLVERLVKNRFQNLYFSTNYLSSVIEDHFGKGERFGCSVSYLREDQELGTGGPLKYLEGKTTKPILVINGDIVTTLDFGALVDFHTKNRYELTMGTSTYTVQVPYGVVEAGEDGKVSAIYEKPSHNFQVNAGVYVVNPTLLADIPPDISFPITELIDHAIGRGDRVGAFPIYESWSDVGMPYEYIAAQSKADI